MEEEKTVQRVVGKFAGDDKLNLRYSNVNKTETLLWCSPTLASKKCFGNLLVRESSCKNLCRRKTEKKYS